MNEMKDDLAGYYREAETWAATREEDAARSHRRAWIVAAVAGGIALVEAIAIVILLPLRTAEPYTLLVDRQTGNVEALQPMDKQVIAPDHALTRSMLAQYVIARENFDADALREDYRKVALWSGGSARERYVAAMQPSNPASPLAVLPRRATVQTQIRSLSALDGDTALVRFSTVRTDPGGQAQPPQMWAAVITYRFSAAKMSEADRLVNPLGFQVTHYRRDSEMAPEPQAAAAVSAGGAVVSQPPGAVAAVPGAPALSGVPGPAPPPGVMEAHSP